MRASLHLPSFVPFRLNRLAVAASHYLSVIYRERFGLDIPEWRVLVTVGPERGCTARHIAGSTRMHKTRVSRAIAHLEELGLMDRTSSPQDRRQMPLRLSKAGRRLYQELVAGKDLVVSFGGKNQVFTAHTDGSYTVPADDLRGKDAKAVQFIVGHDGIREILEGQLPPAPEKSSVGGLLGGHGQLAWWIINIGVVLIGVIALSRKKSY